MLNYQILNANQIHDTQTLWCTQANLYSMAGKVFSPPKVFEHWRLGLIPFLPILRFLDLWIHYYGGFPK